MGPWERVIVVIFCILSGAVQAQESPTLETNAPGVRWYQVNTPHFRILFPEGFDTQAQRVANTLETVRGPESRTMGTEPRKISVILQNKTSFSNGFVTMAPRRSEFFTMPSQNYNFVGTNDWLDGLAVHEFRHIAQFQRSITGFNKLLYVALGQQATAGMAFAAAPQWFWEGDAVATETAFTESGRGRIPNFDLLFRTNTMAGRTFNYHKQYLRSYKHNIPNHYVLGYNMISYLRKKTNDPMIWEKVVGRSWSVPFIPFAFSNALKKESGLYVTGLYNEMVAARRQDYEKAIAQTELTDFETVTNRKNSAYTDFNYPHQLPNGNVLVAKSGIGDIDQLVVLDANGKEVQKYVQGILNDAAMLSVAGTKVVWNEYRFDPRWLARSYSVVKGYDLGTKESKVFSDHSRYSAAALSPDGLSIATIETTEAYQIRLVILDYESGNVIQTIPNLANDLLAMPRWTGDSKSVVLLRTDRSGKAISKIDLRDGAVTDLLPSTKENVGYPVAFGNYILYNSPRTGIDNIYAVNVNTREQFQVTSSRYGAYNPSVSNDGQIIFYNDQARDGMDVVRIPMDTARWKKVEPVEDSPNDLFRHLAEQEGHSDILNTVPDTMFNVKRYRRASGMINPHSWGPYFVNSLTSVNIGVTSQDLLATTRIDAGYTFDINERTGVYGVGVSYQGFFPVLDVRASLSNRSVNEGNIRYNKIVGPDTVSVVENLTFKWDEKTLEAGLRIPLLTTSSKFLSRVDFGNWVGITSVTNFKNSIDGGGRVFPSGNPQYFFRDYQDNGILRYNHFSFSAYRLLKRSRRDINSKWGQIITMDYFNTPYGGNFAGSQFSLVGTAFVPGFFKHHSIWGYWAYQGSEIPQAFASGKGLDNYAFRNYVPLPRGQSVSRFQNFYSMSVNYTLPLWYPDIAIGPLLNIQRFRANVFFDYGVGKSVFVNSAPQLGYTSVGGELKADFNVMRFLRQFNVGIRYSYGLSPAVTRFELLIGAINF
ncbi:MAG: hypothetical protein SH819_06750 [Cytophagales bacterium]|nr:hypothetical protein [Cytophagales bacterium]